MIPKICHFIWTSGSPMSLLQTASPISFQRKNPDWRVIVWLISQNINELGKNTYTPDYTGKDYFDDLNFEVSSIDIRKERISTGMHGILASDILRLKLLHKFGGVYSDFDTIWLKPMSEWSNIDCIGDPKDFEATCCFYDYTSGHHNNSNIVAEKDSKYINSILEAQKGVVPPYTHQAFNTDLLNRIYPTWDLIRQQYPRVLNIRYSTFYPYSIFNLGQLYLDDNLNVLTNKVMAVHWFNGHHLSQSYIKDFGRSCSMTTILKKEQLCGF